MVARARACVRAYTQRALFIGPCFGWCSLLAHTPSHAQGSERLSSSELRKGLEASASSRSLLAPWLRHNKSPFLQHDWIVHLQMPSSKAPRPEGCTIPQYNLSTTGISVLKARKHHGHALLAATGLSVGRLNAKQSAFLQARMDVWATNQFFLHHHLIPDFYNLEMRALPLHARRSRRLQTSPSQPARPKMQVGFPLRDAQAAGPLIDNSLLWQVFTNNDTKRQAYRKTVFLTKIEHAGAVRKLLKQRAPCPQAIVSYWTRSAMGDCSHRSSRNAIMDRMRRVPFSSNLVQEYCSSSVTRILNLILRLGYRTASLIGVDLTSTEHFYTALPEYSEVARLLPALWDTSVRAFVKAKHSNTTLHATGARGVANFFDGFNLAHGAAGRTRLINLSPESLLVASRHVPTSPLPQDTPAGFLGGGLKEWWRRTVREPASIARSKQR